MDAIFKEKMLKKQHLSRLINGKDSENYSILCRVVTNSKLRIRRYNRFGFMDDFAGRLGDDFILNLFELDRLVKNHPRYFTDSFIELVDLLEDVKVSDVNITISDIVEYYKIENNSKVSKTMELINNKSKFIKDFEQLHPKQQLAVVERIMELLRADKYGIKQEILDYLCNKSPTFENAIMLHREVNY
jgi:hypothetical protein